MIVSVVNKLAATEDTTHQDGRLAFYNAITAVQCIKHFLYRKNCGRIYTLFHT